MILKEQDGKIIYSDGETTEQNMLEIAENYPEDLSADFISKDSKYTINNTFSLVRHNILNWYEFNKDSEILEIGAGMGSITGMLADRCRHLTAVEMNQARADVIRARFKNRENLSVISEDITVWDTHKKFDYIVVIGVLEYAAVFSESKNPFVEFLVAARKLLRPNGIMLLAIENRFGLKYWCGGSEDHLQSPWVGLDGYIEPRTPRTFSKAELEKLMTDAGFIKQRFYYVLPDYKFPQLIFTDDADISFNVLANIKFTYSKGSLLTLNEKKLYSDIIENKRLDFFANSYLLEVSPTKISDKYPIFISARSECMKHYRINTKILNDKTVIKEAAISEAKKHIIDVYNNILTLRQRGVKTITCELKEDRLIIPYSHLKKADDVFVDKVISNDIDSLYLLIDKLKQAIKSSSELTLENNIVAQNINSYFTNDKFGGILKDAYIDMTFYNAFYDEGELIFYDQEWKFSNVPMSFILFYSIKSAFERNNLDKNATYEMLLEYSGCLEHKDIYEKLESYIWSNIVTRSGDIYGEDGYCNSYSDKLKLTTVLAQKDETLQELLNLEKNLNTRITQLLNLEKNLNTRITQLLADEAERKKYIEQLIISERALVGELNFNRNELVAIYNSKGWKLLTLARKVATIVIPTGSLRRSFAKLVYRILKFNYKALRYLYRNGLHSSFKCAISCFKGKKADRKVPEFVSFIHCNTPLVSIIIPAYNQFDYTMCCLGSISENSGDIEYEVILADDNSNDKTKKILKYTENLVVVRNEKNMKFLKNCNNAAKSARGKYILFLNNDTMVKENWLYPLIDILEKDSTVGLVGSKLIYPDGKLQEAGGIIWKDATGWNYGRDDDSTSPAYNYVKDVDYISGASIALPKKLWDEIGGFDERYAPAYYEDSDLAFEVRKSNLRVVYQPLSIVIHFEGVSNGIDTSSGQKAYQLSNKCKFIEKWKDVLDQEHFDGGKSPFLARDRSRFKKTVLYVDHYVPFFDRDAGSRNTLSNLQLLVELGFNVKFIGDNFYRHEPYTTNLQQMGIEVLYGNYYANNWSSWVADNSEYISVVLLSRPHIAPKYIDIIKSKTKAKIIYHPHDLHYLRTLREYEITKDSSLIAIAENLKKTEFELIRKSDVAITLSTLEKKEILKNIADKDVVVIPMYNYTSFTEPPKQLAFKRDLLFVGGFSHNPNEDGVVWFINDVYQIVKSQIPELKLMIVGSNPTPKVMSMITQDIVIESNVSDVRLKQLYDDCRVAIIPLRYGAGVKGKTLEAMSHNIGVVSTAIGTEGLIDIDSYLPSDDTSEDFAKRILELYSSDETLLKNMSRNKEYLKKYLSHEYALEVFDKLFKV